MKKLLVVYAFGCLLVIVGCISPSSMGTEGGACFEGGKCLDGLTCSAAGTCEKVAPQADGGTDAGATDGGTTSDAGQDAGIDAEIDGGADTDTDSGTDAGTDGSDIDVDTGTDAETDAGTDTGDTGDDGDTDASVDASVDAGPDAGVGPVITSIDGEGTQAQIVDPNGLVTGLPGRTDAVHRFQKKWVVTGARLDTVTGAKLEKSGGGSVFTAADGLAFESGGTDMKRNLLLPAALVTGAFALTLSAPSGTASADVYVLQGEPPSSAAEAPGVNCQYGGLKFTSGSGVSYVCNGAPGSKGDTGVGGVSVTLASEAPGTNCATGGVKVTSATGDEYVCNGPQGIQGTQGTKGDTGLQGNAGVSVTGVVESPGGNCTYGGVKYTSGSGTNYVCNGAQGVQGTSNCRLDYTGNTLSILGSDGNPLSAGNPCIVKVTDAKMLSFTSPVSTTFGASSDTAGNVFGITAGVAWPNAMPMFLHVCDGSSGGYFAFSRNPARTSSGVAATDMCQKGDSGCDAQGDMFIMGTGLTLANEVSRPCVTVGSFEATMDASNRWLVETLVAGRDGFGVFQEGVQFTMPAGQNGAKPGNYVKSDNTTPTWSYPSYLYTINLNGFYSVSTYFTNVTGGTAGAGSGGIFLVLPAAAIGRYWGGGTNYRTGGGTVINGTGVETINDLAYMYNNAMNLIVENDQSTAEREMKWNVSYKAF